MWFPRDQLRSYGVEFADVPNGLGALSKVPALGWLQIVLLAGVTEIQIYNDRVNGEPGNYGAGFLASKSIGFTSNGFTDPEYRKMKLNAELANGRLAMMAIIGMFFQDGLTGSAWGDWANYTDSPLRAFESETGVQPPVGFWDPLGLSSDGSAFNFARRREVELKHGRVSMFATIGYIVPEYYKLPGFLSPSCAQLTLRTPLAVSLIASQAGPLKYMLVVPMFHKHQNIEDVYSESTPPPAFLETLVS